MWLVLQALESGNELKREQAHSAELPIAQLTAIYVNSQKTKPPYARLYDFCLFKSEGESLIPPEICDTFLKLVDDNDIPSWAISLAPLDEIRKGKGNGRVMYPRLWMCRGLALIAPRLEEGVLTAGIVVAEDDHPFGEVEVWDVDTQKSHTLRIPENLPASTTEVAWDQAIAKEVLL